MTREAPLLRFQAAGTVVPKAPGYWLCQLPRVPAEGTQCPGQFHGSSSALFVEQLWLKYRILFGERAVLRKLLGNC